MGGTSTGGAAPGGQAGGNMFNKTTSAAPGGSPQTTGLNVPQQGLYGVPGMQSGTPSWIQNMMNGYASNLTPNYQDPKNFGMFAYGNDFANYQNRFVSNFGLDAMNPWQRLGGGGAITGWPIQPGQPGGPPPGGGAPPGTTPPATVPPKTGPAAGSMQEAIALGLGTGNSSALNALVKPGGMTQEQVNQSINSAMYNNTAQTNADAMDAYRKSIGYTGPVQTW